MDIIYAWIASIASGITPLVIKASSRSLIKDPWLFNFMWTLFSIPLVVALALVKGGGLPHHWTSLVLLAVSYTGFFIFYTVSLYRIDVSTMAPLFSLRTVFAALLGFFVLHERISIFGVVLMAIIVLCSPLAAYSEKLRMRSFFTVDVYLAIVAMAMLALVGYFTNISVHDNGYATTLLWQDILVLGLLMPTLIFVSKPERVLTKRQIVPFILIGITDFLYTASATLAYAHNLAISSVIVSLPLSMIFAYLLSKRYSTYFESHNTQVYVVRFAGATVMVVCAIWLSFLN